VRPGNPADVVPRPPKNQQETHNAAMFSPISALFGRQQAALAGPPPNVEDAMKLDNARPIPGRDQVDLVARYGPIGISAVTAALRYRGDRKNPAYAPSPPSSAYRFVEASN
jgi:hypothetical protein